MCAHRQRAPGNIQLEKQVRSESFTSSYSTGTRLSAGEPENGTSGYRFAGADFAPLSLAPRSTRCRRETAELVTVYTLRSH